MKKILSLLVVLFTSISAYSAEDTVEYSKTFNVPAVTSSAFTTDSVSLESKELYTSADEVFDAYHNKLIASVFGKAGLIWFLKSATDDVTVKEIEALDASLYQQYLLPFNKTSTKIISVALIAFTIISTTYITFIGVKFALEKLLITAGLTEKAKSNTKSTISSVFFRALISIGVLSPLLVYVSDYEIDEDGLSDVVGSSYINRFTLMLVGASAAMAERITREFSYDESLYNPNYFVPSPDYLGVEFDEITNFASCIASESAGGTIQVKSHVNGILGDLSSKVMNDFKLEYVASYKNCSLKISTVHDRAAIINLSNAEISKAIGLDANKFAQEVESVYKSEFDSYLKIALPAAMLIAKKVRREKEEVSNDVTVDMKSWFKKCDETYASAQNESLTVEENLVAYQKLPMCFSRSFIKRFSYPVKADGQDFDAALMGEDDIPIGSRWVQICESSSTDPTSGITKTSDQIKNCAAQVCNFDSAKSSIFACSVMINSVSSYLNINQVNDGGFFLAPVVAQKQLEQEISDDAKSYLKKITASAERYVDSSEGNYATRDSGDIIFKYQLKFSESELFKLEQIKEAIESTLFKSVDSVNYPNFYINSQRTLPELISGNVARFSYCLQHRGQYAEDLGVCGNSYQEASRFVHSYVTLIAISYAITLIPSIKKVKKDKGFGSVSSEKNLSGSSKKVVLAMLAAAGVGAIVDFVISDDEIDSLVEYFMPAPDPFSSDVYIYNVDPISKGVIAAIVLSFNDNGVVVSVLRTALGWIFILFSAFTYLPALLFVTTISMAVLNLVVFVITLPFQLAHAFSDSSRQSGRYIRVLMGKWILTLCRFPLTIAGFFTMFVVFDAILPSLIETTQTLAITMDVDGAFAFIFSALFSFVLYGVAVFLLLYISLNTMNQFYQIAKSYLVEAHSEDQRADDLDRALSSLNKVKK
ncbi:hypothetical protein CTH30272_03048 [Allocatenococcus thiocycli]|nr:hypothetical protein CTH30272_03048 [Catenococcus thiocycli]